MKTLIKNNSLRGFSIFSDPEKWQNLLSDLPILNECFFFFNEERGNHLNLFFRNLSPEMYIKTEEYLVNFLKKSSSDYQNIANDLLFKNFEVNIILPIHYLETTQDLVYDSKTKDETILNFLFEFSSILIASLSYNNYFVKEKNRLNFALQLVLMSLIKADGETRIKEIEKEIKNDEVFKIIFTNSKTALLNIFEELKKIEEEVGIEDWVKDWLKLANNFLGNTTILLMIEIICQVLNIKTQKKQLIYLIKETLKSSQIKI